MYCEECGAELKDGAKFCKNCGHKVSDDAEVSPASKTVEQTKVNSAIKNNGKASGKTVAPWVYVCIGVVATIFVVVIGLVIMNGMRSTDKDNADASEAKIKTSEPSESAKEGKNSEKEASSYLSEVRKGEYITFGTYEQDNNLDNGAEPIEWEVLDIEGDKALLISRYVLDRVEYNETKTNITWETCALRTWLNNTFYDAAFSDTERKIIQTVTLTNEDNTYWWSEGGEDTNDKVFCISAADIIKYYTFSSWDEQKHVGYCKELMTQATEYAKRDTLNTLVIDDGYFDEKLSESGYSRDMIGTEGSSWWTRTSGGGMGGWRDSVCPSSRACYVNMAGRAGEYNDTDINNHSIGVRPSIYVSIK